MERSVTNEISDEKPEPLFVQLKTLIQNWIERGEFVPHDQIYSEREFSEKYNISRQTVRQALNELVLRGILYRQPGKGTYVAPKKVSTNLFQAVSFTNMLRDSGKITNTKTIIKEKIIASPFAQEMLELQSDELIVKLVRLRFLDEEPAAIHRSYFHPNVYSPELMEEENHIHSIIFYLEETVGVNITQAEETLEPTIANRYEAELLDVAEGAPLQLIEGRLLTEEGNATECHKSLYRGDRFSFKIGARVE